MNYKNNYILLCSYNLILQWYYQCLIIFAACIPSYNCQVTRIL